jgi:hypothetical protein
MALHATDAVPETEMLLELSAPQMSPLDGRSVRATFPLKSYKGVTIIVAVVDEPTFALGAAGADRRKSG